MATATTGNDCQDSANLMARYLGKRQMKRLLLLLALTGCTQTVLKPVPVEVPVEVTCKIKEPASPRWPTLALSPTAGLFDRTKATLAELELRKAYEGKLLAAIRSCQ